MAVGGWKHTSFSWTGGSAASENVRVQEVLAGCCNAIVSAGVGWSFDETYNADANSPTQMGSGEYGLFLVHASTGAKLCVKYNYAVTGLHATQGMSSSTLGLGYIAGLAMALIPPAVGGEEQGSWNTASNCSTSSFIPLTAVRFCGLNAPQTTASGSYTRTSVYENYSARVYTWNFVLRSDSVFCIYRASNWNATAIRAFFIGKLLDEAAHAEDLRLYGAVCFTPSLYAENTADTSSRVSANSAFAIACALGSRTNEPLVCCFRAGIATEPPSGAGSSVAIDFWAETNVLSEEIAPSDVSGLVRFAAFWIAVRSINPNTYGVVTGDGFKGFVDTEVMRCVHTNFTRGQTFGDSAGGKDFIYLGGGVAIGWDAANTTSFV